MTNKELSAIWAKLYEQGQTIEEIARDYKKSSYTIYTWLKKKNVTIRHAKQAKGTWRDVPIDKAKELYQTGMSIARVARKLDFSQGMVRYALNKNGIKTRRRNNKFTDEEVITLYEQGYSMEAIATMFGVKRTKIRTALLLNDANIRHREPYDFLKCDAFIEYEPYGFKKRTTNYTKSILKYATRSKIFTDENFFNEWSHELAYFLGWMASDGNIVKEKHVFRITSTDIGHLKKLFSMFSYGWTVSIRKWNKLHEMNHNPAGTIAIARKDIVRKLMEYGIMPKKSLTIKMPYVPPQYLRDFARGVFEGDGCITLKKSLYPKIVFASGSKEFLDGLGAAIEKQTGLKVYVSVDKNGTWHLDYNSPAATEILFHYFYDGVPSNMILERKYNKFLEYFKTKAGDDDGNDKCAGTRLCLQYL